MLKAMPQVAVAQNKKLRTRRPAALQKVDAFSYVVLLWSKSSLKLRFHFREHSFYYSVGQAVNIIFVRDSGRLKIAQHFSAGLAKQEQESPRSGATEGFGAQGRIICRPRRGLAR